MIIWLTGLSGSGKTTFSKFLIRRLNTKIKKKVIHIDGDKFRSIFNDLKYSLKDRIKNSERACKLASFLNESGQFIIIVSMVSISQKWLNWIRKKNNDYFQIFLDVSLNTLKKRNVRNVYKKKDIVGINIKYTKPTNNDLILKNNFKKLFLKKAVNIILNDKKIKNTFKKYEKS
jgi:adenylylsulfate kinase